MAKVLTHTDQCGSGGSSHKREDAEIDPLPRGCGPTNEVIKKRAVGQVRVSWCTLVNISFHDTVSAKEFAFYFKSDPFGNKIVADIYCESARRSVAVGDFCVNCRELYLE